MSADGRTLLVPCYNVTAGTPLGGYASSAARVIARVYASGGVDTTTYTTDAMQAPNVFTSAVSTDGFSGFWLSGSSFQVTEVPLHLRHYLISNFVVHQRNSACAHRRRRHHKRL